jgi:hypothetical protein
MDGPMRMRARAELMDVVIVDKVTYGRDRDPEPASTTTP